jgi:hypothetical protein
LAEILVDLAGGPQVAFQAGEAGVPDETCFILAVRKCGSSILNSMVADLARQNGRHYLDVAGQFYHADVPERVWRNDPACCDLLVPGQVHGGFRAMPLIFADHPIYAAARKILLVRDPRDALVSEFFSNAYSHALPRAAGGGQGAAQDMLTLRQAALRASIETYVLRQAAALNRTFMEYEAASADPRTRVFRYEDVIMNKRAWVRNIAAHFGWSRPDEAFLDGMMGWADVVPQAEQSDQFIRRVRPGDHKEKLSRAVIGRLDDILAPALRLFSY